MALGQAYRQARAGIAVSDSARSDYLTYHNVIMEIDGVDFSRHIRMGSLSIRQSLNDEPDTCSLTLVPDVPFYPNVGARIIIAVGGMTRPEFGGRVITVQHVRAAARQKPMLSLTCADHLIDFDQRAVVYGYPKQSATTTVQDLVARFCTHFVPFTTNAVQPGLPVLEAFEIINERPSAVLRQIVNLLPGGGGFYVDPFGDVHLWAGAFEPGQTPPRDLVLDMATLHSFAYTLDGAQVRTSVRVEGMTTTAPAGIPNMPTGVITIGFPVEDATFQRVANEAVGVRVGSQLLQTASAGPALDPTKPNGAKVTAINGANPLYYFVSVDTMAPWLGRGNTGWVKVNDSYFYMQDRNDTETLAFARTLGWGDMTAAPSIGDTIEIVDYLRDAHGDASYAGHAEINTPIRAQPPGATVAFLTRTNRTPVSTDWPGSVAEHVISDGRYSRVGARERGVAELDMFGTVDGLTVAQWDTDDPNAKPGRVQVVALDEPDPYAAALMIQTADLSFPVAGRPPLRRCSGSRVKRSSILDVMVTRTS